MDYIQTGVSGCFSDSQRAGNRFAPQSFNCVPDYGFAVVVEGLAGAEFLDIGEIAGRRRGNDLIPGCDSNAEWRCFRRWSTLPI